MVPFVYRCPKTGVQVQGWTADDGADNGRETYQGEHCPVCNKLHFVNPKTSKMLGFDGEYAAPAHHP